jgi:hypothetical protein
MAEYATLRGERFSLHIVSSAAVPSAHSSAVWSLIISTHSQCRNNNEQMKDAQARRYRGSVGSRLAGIRAIGWDASLSSGDMNSVSRGWALSAGTPSVL